MKTAHAVTLVRLTRGVAWLSEGIDRGAACVPSAGCRDEKRAENDDFGQPGTLYRQVMNDTDRDHLVTNIVDHASDDVSDEVR
jgi:catalase